MEGSLVGLQVIIGHKGFPAEDALVPAFPSVPHLVLGAVLSQGKHLLTVPARVLPPPGVYIAVPLQAGQGHVGTLTGRTHIEQVGRAKRS